MRRRSSPEGLVVGLGLVGIGLAWTLGNLGMVDALHVVRTWWPALLVVWGVLELLNWREAAARGGRR